MLPVCPVLNEALLYLHRLCFCALLQGNEVPVAFRRRQPRFRTAQVERGLPPALRTAANAVEVRRSAIHNWGLFTTRPVPKDGMVVEYMGSGLRSILADVKEKMYADLPRTIPLPPPPLPLPSLSPPPSGASLLPQVREGHRQGTGRRLLHVPPRRIHRPRRDGARTHAISPDLPPPSSPRPRQRPSVCALARRAATWRGT